MTISKLLPSLVAGVIATIFIAYNLTAVHFVGPYAWDDGAITLAYSKTLAETGRFALTASSEIVEGTSSLLLTFLMAALHAIFKFDFNRFIFASQLLAYIFLMATLLLMYPAIKKGVGQSSHAPSFLAIFALLPMFSAEILNGMEMTMFAFLITLYYLKFYKDLTWPLLLTPLILLARFESIFYLGLTLLLMIIVEQEKKRTLLIGLYTCFIFAILTFLRWTYFDDIFPNTIWAKMNPPYSSENLSGSIIKKVSGGIEFIQVVLWLLLPLIIVFITKSTSSPRRYLGYFLILSFAAFSLITGKNGGYKGRMFLACVPIILLLALHRTSELEGMKLKVISLPSKSEITFSYKTLLLWILLLSLALTHIANARLHLGNLKTFTLGGYHQGLLPESVSAIVEKRLALSNPEFKSSFGVTPENYRITGMAVDSIRKILKMQKISFMVPDVGGLGLCCSQIEVIDSALLTNKSLARQGYKYFNTYLETRSPYIIQTHGIWSNLSGIYDSEYFKINYTPIVFDNNLLWVKNDVYDKLKSSNVITTENLKVPHDLELVRYAGSHIDMSHLASQNFITITAFKSF